MEITNVLMSKRFLLILIIVFFISEQVCTAIPSISCSPCNVGNCQCTISGCSSGAADIYETACTGAAKYTKYFSTTSIIWNPPQAINYYIKILCDDSSVSACTLVSVSGNTSTTTTSTITTVTGTTTTTTSATTTTTIRRECSYDDPCPAEVGKRIINQQMNTQDYYEYVINSNSNVTIRLDVSSNVDYDLYVKWDGSKPDEEEYDCLTPHKGTGEREECNYRGLPEGTYYMMVKYYEGTGSYNLSVTSKLMGCSDQNHPCKIDCGKAKYDMTTNNKDYYTYKLTSMSNVTVRLSPSSDADYDLYVNWDKTKPSTDKYDCKPAFDKGDREECKVPNLDFPDPLETGDYYIMVDFFEGYGTYDLSLSCTSERTVTTTTHSTTTTTTITTVTGTTTTTIKNTTTTKITTTTIMTSTCGDEGECINGDEGCDTGYENCNVNDDECSADEICCCPKVEPPVNYGILIGLFLTFVLIILVYFYLKSKSKITYEKLYSKWSRVFVG
jgi:hypothetical protein